MGQVAALWGGGPVAASTTRRSWHRGALRVLLSVFGSSLPGIALAAFLIPFLAPPAHADRAARLLAPFERPDWPSFLGGLSLDPGRAYVVLVQIPSQYPIDLSSPEAARVSLLKNTLTPFARIRAKTLIGHTMVGWQCATGRGLISKTGEESGQAMRMALSGWGLTPLLSTYLDGRLITLDRLSWRHKAQVLRGRANVLAAEIGERSCQAMRRFLVDYLTDPAQPSRRFGLLLDADGFEGDGCASFALAVASRSGLFRGILHRFHRRIEIHEGMLGRRARAPDAVVPYPGAPDGKRARIVGFAQLRDGPWDDGRLRATFDVVDPELIYSAIVALRRMAGETDGFRGKRALPLSDPDVRRVGAATTDWARRHFRTARFVDPRGISALVLER